MDQHSREKAMWERIKALNPSIVLNRTCVPLYDTTRALYERAIADPSSLSDEKRRKILQRLPCEEGESLCYDICGSTMSELMSLSGSTKTRVPCGFIVCYPKYKDADCSLFKERLEIFISHGFHRYLGALKEPIMNGFKLHDRKYDSLESLYSHFVSMRQVGDIPTGIRQDMFLYVDEEVI